MRELMTASWELADSRRVLRNVGGNLNQVARVVNATGVPPRETERVLHLVDRAVHRVDHAAAALLELLGSARVRRQRAG